MQQLSYSVQLGDLQKKGVLILPTQLQQLKKKLLRKVGMLASNHSAVKVKFRVTMETKQQCWMPLLNNDDMQVIVKRQAKIHKDVAFKLGSSGPLNPKNKRKKAVKIEFDSQGQIDSVESEYEFVVPSNPPYRGHLPVKCVFCHRSSQDRDYVKLHGPFYGPFKNRYCHLLCAIWAPNVYLSEDTNELVNINKEIQRAGTIFCRYCGERGGVLGCQNADCRISAHFDCALQKGSHLDWNNYTMTCRACLDKSGPKRLKEEFKLPVEEAEL